jgi:hypothetical protein
VVTCHVYSIPHSYLSFSYPYPTKWGRYSFHHVVIKIRHLFFTVGRLPDVNPPWNWSGYKWLQIQPGPLEWPLQTLLSFRDRTPSALTCIPYSYNLRKMKTHRWNWNQRHLFFSDIFTVYLFRGLLWLLPTNCFVEIRVISAMFMSEVSFHSDVALVLSRQPDVNPPWNWSGVLTTVNAAGTNGLTCLPKHGGVRDNKFWSLILWLTFEDVA